MTTEYKNPSIYLALDLEMNQPSGKIIQIGAVVGDILSGEILETLSVVIDPKEPLNPFITTLTGITEVRIKSEGVTLKEAYVALKALHGRYNAHTNPITWGGGDSQQLYSELTAPKTFSWGGFVISFKSNSDAEWPFGRRWIDAKTVYQAYCLAKGIKMQSGLKKSCRKLGVLFEGPAHDAAKDALATFKIYRELISRIKNI